MNWSSFHCLFIFFLINVFTICSEKGCINTVVRVTKSGSLYDRTGKVLCSGLVLISFVKRYGSVFLTF